MTTEAYARAVLRESTIWPAFQYPILFTEEQVIERVIVFGLFANAYNNNHNYLFDIETTELSNLLDNYNLKTAGLAAEEQVIVIQLAARAYTAEIEKAIHAEQLASKRAGINADINVMNAKLAALAADRAALRTLQARLTAEEKKVAARLAILEAESDEEDVRYQMVVAEISEKEIQELEVQLKINRVGIDIAKIQLQIAEAAIDLIEVDLRVAEIDNRAIGMEIEGIRAGFTATEVKIANAEVTIEDKTNDLAEIEKTLAEEKRDTLIETVIPAYEEIKLDIEEIILKKSEAQGNINANELAKMQYAVDMNELKNDERAYGPTLDKIMIEADNTVRDNQTETATALNTIEASAEWSMANAAINAAITAATATVTTVLNHTIGKTAAT